MTTEEFLDGLRDYITNNYASFLSNQPGSLPDFKERVIGGRDPFDCGHYPSLSMHLSNEDEEWRSLTDLESELKIDMAISVMNPKADTAHRYQLRYAEAMKEMLFNSAMAQDMIQRSQKIVREHFTLDIMTDRVLAIYEEALDSL